MKILFCKTSYMRFYRGVNENDIPRYGGKYVEENGYGHEEFNFDPVEFSDGNIYCLGFVETKSSHGKRNELHVERIGGCEAMKNADSVDDVLVVWCATIKPDIIRVVGWYKHATVFRTYQECEFPDGYVQGYNVMAQAKDCTLLPEELRGYMKWDIRKAKKYGYGFGQAMVWFATEDAAQEYVKNLVDTIEQYSGPNVAEEL